MTMPSKMEKVQLVDQTVMFEQFESAIDGYACNFGVDLLGLLEDFGSIHVANRRFDHLNNDAALAREANVTRAQLALKLARRLVNIDAFARGDAVCRSGRHLGDQYSKMRLRGLAYRAFGYW
jgi:hypothetical protein